MANRFDGQLVLVTGASRGLGFALAKAFAAEGAHVIATARTVGGLEELDDAIKAAGGAVTLAPLDLQEPDMLDQMAGAFHARFGKLDILVHAAAQLGELSPAPHIAPKTWDKLMAVNLSATYRLIRAFDPLLRASERGRAVFATCEAGSTPRAFWGAYSATKAGMEMLVRCYAEEVAKAGIGVHLVDPGPMQTRLRRDAYPGEQPGTQPEPEEATQAFLDAVA